MEMQGNATEIDERNLLQLDALLSHGYGLSPQLVMRSKGLSIEAKALYGYLSSFAGAGDTAFPSTSRILEELDISKKGGVSNRITGIKIWLEGDIAKEYDIAYRAFIYGQGWTQRFHSNGGSQDDAELCGSDDASGSKGARLPSH